MPPFPSNEITFNLFAPIIRSLFKQTNKVSLLSQGINLYTLFASWFQSYFRLFNSALLLTIGNSYAFDSFCLEMDECIIHHKQWKICVTIFKLNREPRFASFLENIFKYGLNTFFITVRLFIAVRANLQSKLWMICLEIMKMSKVSNKSHKFFFL